MFAGALANNERFGGLSFVPDPSLRRHLTTPARCTRGSADDSTHSPSSDRLSISAGGRPLAAPAAFVGGDRTDTLALLKDLCAGVSGQIRYQSRDDEGTQSPIETLDRGWGSCRDFAVLFVEAARSLGLGWAQATFSVLARCSSDRQTPDQRTPGAKSLCRGLGGSASIRRTAASAARTSFQSLSRVTFGKRRVLVTSTAAPRSVRLRNNHRALVWCLAERIATRLDATARRKIWLTT
jgi:hypothetical protein